MGVAWSDSAGDTLLRTFPPAWLGLGRLYPPGGAAGLVRQRDLGISAGTAATSAHTTRSKSATERLPGPLAWSLAWPRAAAIFAPTSAMSATDGRTRLPLANRIGRPGASRQAPRTRAGSENPGRPDNLAGRATKTPWPRRTCRG